MEQTGHFRFASGRHAREKIDFEVVERWPRLKQVVCFGLAALIDRHVPETVQAIASVANGANGLLAETATAYNELRRTSAEMILTNCRKSGDGEKYFTVDEDSSGAFARLSEEEPVGIVEDVINHFTSSQHVAGLFLARDIRVAAIVAGLRRGPADHSPTDIPGYALVTRAMPDWPAEDCSDCAAGLPLTKV
jgi:orotate phosphoribosyltransferase